MFSCQVLSQLTASADKSLRKIKWKCRKSYVGDPQRDVATIEEGGRGTPQAQHDRRRHAIMTYGASHTPQNCNKSSRMSLP